MARSCEPYALITMIVVSGEVDCAARISSSPSSLGIRTSVTRAS